MIDQSFDIKSLLEIFNLENRKGNDIEDCFPIDFSKSIKIREEISKVNTEIKLETNPVLKKDLYVKKSKLKKQREETIDLTLGDISTRIYKHSINLSPTSVYGMTCYVMDDNIENLFISKKIQSNISEIYNVSQSSRFSILSQLITLIEDKFPKYIVRTDISSFYESIPQFPLLEKIRTDNLLSVKSIQFIEQIFTKYNVLTSQTDPKLAKGVPRGVGISAYLVELYMKKIDSRIRNLDDLVFYARYVDDIIIVFVPKDIQLEIKKGHYLNEVKSILKSETAGYLKLNSTKTKEYNCLVHHNCLQIPKKLSSSYEYNYKKAIKYLGYKIGFNGNGNNQKLVVALSENKINKFKEKIEVSFSCFNSKFAHNPKKQFSSLKARINYLCSNSRLLNNKCKVLIGTYYSNPFVTNSDCFERIQKFYYSEISRSKLNNLQKKELKAYSFKSSFENRRFSVLSIRDKKYNVLNAKINDTLNQRNNGVVKVGLIKIKQIW